MACEFEDDEPIVSVLGCTDPLALNYFSGATIDDGSCQYPQPISGCTDPSAINYNEEATIEDCGCIYSECPDILVSGLDGSIFFSETIGGEQIPLGEDCCTEEVVGQDVTWDGRNCVYSNRVDCPKEIVIRDGNVVYYNQPIQSSGGYEEINIDKNFLGRNTLPLRRNCCTEEVVGEPVTWDPTFIINDNREPGACILDTLPEICELTLEDIIYVGDTVVTNCLVPDDSGDTEEDSGGDLEGVIDNVKDCVDISGTEINYPKFINQLSTTPTANGPYVILVTTDENVLNLSTGGSIELSNFGTVMYSCGSIPLNGLTTITEILEIPNTSNPTSYAIVLPITPPSSCNQTFPVDVNGTVCPIENTGGGETTEPPTCYSFDKFQFQKLFVAGNFEGLGAGYQTLCNENGLNNDDYYLFVTLTNTSDLPTACENYTFNQTFFDLKENSCWGGTLNLDNNSSYKLLHVGTLGNDLVALFNISIPFSTGTFIEANCEDTDRLIVNGDFEFCSLEGKSIGKSTFVDKTTELDFTRGGAEDSYIEGIILTYNQTYPGEGCQQNYTNNQIDLDPTIFNCTTKNTILELNFNSGNQNCCEGYFQITIVGPSNFQETIQSNQTQEIILPKAGEYEITLDLVYFNCESSLSVISKIPQTSLNTLNFGEIELLPLDPIILPILDPCDIEEDNIDPVTCPNLSEFCCNELGSDLGWEFIDGVCYWNPPNQPTDLEIGVSENDIVVPDSGCTDLNVSLFFYMEKPDDPECIGDENVTATLAFYSGDNMNNDSIFTTTEISSFNLSTDGYCDWVQIATQINGYAGENFKIKLILNNVIECCDYNIFVDDIKVDCVIDDSITVNNKFQCPGFKLDRVIDNKKSWVYNDGLPINRIFAPSPDADLPWRYTDYLQQSGVYEKHSKLVLNSKEMELTFNMCSVGNCTPTLNIFELLDYKKNFQTFWIKFIEQFVPATTIFIAGEKWCTKEEDICPVYDDCDYDNNFDLHTLGVIEEKSKPINLNPPLKGDQINVGTGDNTTNSNKFGDWGKNNKPNGEPIILDGFVGSFIEEKEFQTTEKLTFRRGELPLLKQGMRIYFNKFSESKTRLINE